jgi:hypothetical protein
MTKKISFPFFLLTVILALEGQAAEIRLPRTRQVDCFDGAWGSPVDCRNSGQDGEYGTGAVNSGDKFNGRYFAWPLRGGELGALYSIFLPLLLRPCPGVE